MNRPPSQQDALKDNDVPEIVARHYGTGQPVRVSWETSSGLVRSVDPLPASTAHDPDLWVAPGLFDLQINGFAGVDFQQDDVTGEALLTAVGAIRRAGCTRFFLTLMTDEWPMLMNRLRRLARLRAQSPELREAIAGWHIEGPFLSSEPGYHGAHRAELMLDPTLEHIHGLREAADDSPLLLTIAPERRNAIAAIRLAASLKISVALGHTNAPVELLREAAESGAVLFTHLGNGCPRLLDRQDNILWRMLDSRALPVSVIPDQVHVSPALFRLIDGVLPDGSILYVSDAMSAAAASPGRYSLGPLQLEVGEDQVVRLPGTPNFAGSALRPIEGVFRAAEMLHTPWQKAWKAFSEVPARLVGIGNELKPGQRANLCLLRVKGGKPESLSVWCAGRPVAQAPA